MLRLESISLGIGERDLVVDGSLHVRPGDRIGLVGRSGVGKTTLLRAMAGERLLDGGTLWRRPDVSIGFLRQEGGLGSTDTVWDEASKGMVRVNRLKARLEAAEEAVRLGAPGAIERLGEVSEEWRQAGGYATGETIGEVLHGLGFRKEDVHRPCSTFSGGWQVRISLARLLLSDADLLLLDEPTNHLDFLARSWLASYLTSVGKAVVVVSHDRYLLDRVCLRVVEIRDARLHTFTGNLSAWLVEREQRLVQAQEAFRAQQKQVERLERFVERFRAKPTKASQARSRQKELDRMEILEAPRAETIPHLRLPPPPHSAWELVTMERVSLAWPEGPVVLDDVTLQVTRGMRLVVLGPNGGGKSTLAHALGGRLAVRAGRRVVGEGARLGFFSQDLSDRLPGDVTASEYVLSVSPFANPQVVRATLGAIGLPGEFAMRPMAQLSGGEKARVALSCFTVQAHNLLILDEPTNHLDAVTVDVLAAVLAEFAGALVVITHDRFLAEAVATHVAVVRDGRVEVHEGVQPEDFEIPRGTPVREPEGAEAARVAASYEERKRQAREAERVHRRIAAIGAAIEALERRLEALDQDLCSVGADYQRAHALSVERAGVEAEVEALFGEWSDLERPAQR